MFMLLVRAVYSRPWLDPRREIKSGPRPYSCGEERAVIKIGNAAAPVSDADNRRAELELARRARRGDAAAFDELVRRFHRPVYRFCWRLLRSADAEDLAQDTFVRAFVHFERFDPERPVLPWLIAIARRLCLDLLGRGKVMPGQRQPWSAARRRWGPRARPRYGSSFRVLIGLLPIWTRDLGRPSSSSTSRKCHTGTSRPLSRCRWAR